MAASVIHSAGSGRFTAPMKPRSAMNHQPGTRLQPRPIEILAGKRARRRRLAEREQRCPAATSRAVSRRADHKRRPQADAQCAAHHARLACAKACAASGATADIRPMPTHEGSKQDDVRQRGAGDRLVAEPARCSIEVGGHHRDLAELRQRDRQSELHRGAQFRRQGEAPAGASRPAA